MINKFSYFFIILFFYLFRFVLSRFIPFGEFLYIGVSFPFLLYNFYKSKFDKIIGYLMVYNIFFLFFLIISLIKGINLGVIFTSFLSYTFFLNFWVFFINSNLNSLNRIVKIMYNFVLIISLGAIVQFFYDPNLFGLIDYSIYSDDVNLSKSVFSKRAISIIKSPQTLGFVLVLFLIHSKHSKNIIIFIAGVLTFTKAFFLAVIIKLFLNFKFKTYLILVSFIFMLIFAIQNFSNISGFERIYSFLYSENLNSQNERILRWLYYINNFEYLTDYIYGNGLGIGSRSYEILTNKSLEYSSESFVIQLFSETGFLGLFVFFTPFFYLFLINKKVRINIFIFFILLFISPAFYGFSVTFLIYPLLLLPFFKSLYPISQ